MLIVCISDDVKIFMYSIFTYTLYIYRITWANEIQLVCKSAVYIDFKKNAYISLKYNQFTYRLYIFSLSQVNKSHRALNLSWNSISFSLFQELLLPVTKLADLLITSLQDVNFIDDDKAANILYGSYAAVWNLVAQVRENVFVVFVNLIRKFSREVKTSEFY